MPYNRENPNELTFVFEDDPAAVAGIQEMIENCREYDPDVTTADIITGTRNSYHVVTVDESGSATYNIFSNVHDTAGKARAEVYNFFLQLDRDEDDMAVTVEIRREVALDGCNMVVQDARGCWVGITRSISVVETIRRRV